MFHTSWIQAMYFFGKFYKKKRMCVFCKLYLELFNSPYASLMLLIVITRERFYLLSALDTVYFLLKNNKSFVKKTLKTFT